MITCLEFSGNRIVSGSDDNTLKVWDVETGDVSKPLLVPAMACHIKVTLYLVYRSLAVIANQLYFSGTYLINNVFTGLWVCTQSYGSEQGR